MRCDHYRRGGHDGAAASMEVTRKRARVLCGVGAGWELLGGRNHFGDRHHGPSFAFFVHYHFLHFPHGKVEVSTSSETVTVAFLLSKITITPARTIVLVCT